MHVNLEIRDGKVGEGILFQRIRRIIGYLVGSVDKFNDGRRAEEVECVTRNVSNG